MSNELPIEQVCRVCVAQNNTQTQQHTRARAHACLLARIYTRTHAHTPNHSHTYTREPTHTQSSITGGLTEYMYYSTRLSLPTDHDAASLNITTDHACAFVAAVSNSTAANAGLQSANSYMRDVGRAVRACHCRPLPRDHHSHSTEHAAIRTRALPRPKQRPWIKIYLNRPASKYIWTSLRIYLAKPASKYFLSYRIHKIFERA